jgi:uncharacterized BrkB/YihY/UPF0761 family membrane protein
MSNVRRRKHMSRSLRYLSWLLAAFLALVGLAVVFFVPIAELSSNRGGTRFHHSGDLFAGLAIALGETPARLLVGGFFLLLAWIVARRDPSRRQKR